LQNLIVQICWKNISVNLPFLGISVVDGLGLVLGGADTATKQIFIFNNQKNQIVIIKWYKIETTYKIQIEFIIFHQLFIIIYIFPFIKLKLFLYKKLIILFISLFIYYLLFYYSYWKNIVYVFSLLLSLFL